MFKNARKNKFGWVVKSSIFATMKKKTTEKPLLESVKISSKIVDRVRENKKFTGVPVGKFFEISADNELKKKEANG